jgi:hypothetical protein
MKTLDVVANVRDYGYAMPSTTRRAPVFAFIVCAVVAAVALVVALL